MQKTSISNGYFQVLIRKKEIELPKELQDYKNIINAFDEELNETSLAVKRRTLQLIKEGYKPDVAFSLALKELGYNATLTAMTLDASINFIETKATIKEAVVRKYWLNKVWPGDEGKFSDSIQRNTASMVESMSKQLEAGETWIKTARNIQKDGKIEAKLPRYLRDLVTAGKKANLSEADMSIYRSAMKKALKNIEKLSLNGAPTKSLKKAYQNLVKKVETFNDEAIAKAVDRTIRNGSKYLAERVSRTEIVRANSVVIQTQIDNDPNVIGWKSDLNSRHPEFDICDIMDDFIFVREIDVLVPYHTFCFCLIRKIYRKGSGTFYSESRILAKASKLLKEQPKNAKKLIAIKNQEKFIKKPSLKYIQNWRKFGKIPRPPEGSIIFD